MPANLLQKLQSLDPATTYTGYQAVQRYGITPEEWATAKTKGWVQREGDGWEVKLQAPQQSTDFSGVRHALDKAPGGSIVTLRNGKTAELPMFRIGSNMSPGGDYFYDADSNQFPVSFVVSIKSRSGQTIYGGRKMKYGMRLSSYYTKVVLSHGNYF